ncbi:hypothetical protein BJY04DRAFT_217152 [Aspergillus karnatakaensis]|uniref:fungal specific transcription factor domain-containing protein n=1 Tax=Aspergillus karnatakaensis TaxID=1810916 RepID=UPI003CCD7C21
MDARTVSPQVRAHAPDRSRRSSPTLTESTSGADEANYHAIQAKNIIQIELGDSRITSNKMQSILKSALELVNGIATSEHRHADLLHEEETFEQELALSIPDVPPREMLFMLFRDPSESGRARWPDHISDQCYERMATALLQGDLNPPSRLYHQYCICVYVKAIVYIDKTVRNTNSAALKEQFSQSRAAYTAAAIRSIQHFSILGRPNLSTIQCLISSALLMQLLGRLNQCWVLNSYAARQITSLNYHKVHRVVASTDEKQDIYNVVYWCFFLDRNLSSLMGRPPSLPDLEVSPSELIQLDPSSPYNILIHFLLDLAEIQSSFHSLSFRGIHQSDDAILEACQVLETRMQGLLPRLQTNRDSLPRVVQHDWISTEFSYYAIFVEIYRTRLKSSYTPLVHRLCLSYSLKSLKAFYFLLEQPAERPASDDPYPSFITWTLFFYPLSPFFVVFCNIVGTLNHENYTLLQNITTRLSQFRRNPHLERLLDLLLSLEQLCKPLFQEQNVDNPIGEDGSAPVECPSALPMVTDNADLGPSLVTHADTNMDLSNATISNTGVGSSTDWMMWQLFNSQVPAGWFNSESDPFPF